jgi:hypothetical protein
VPMDVMFGRFTPAWIGVPTAEAAATSRRVVGGPARRVATPPSAAPLSSCP